VMGGTIEVEVRASLGNLEADTSKNGFQVKGENPEDGELVTETPGTGTDPEERRRGRLAMIWRESSARQFDAFDQTPAFPLVGDDDPGDPDSTFGWGLTQITFDPDRRFVWDWQENLAEGVDRFHDNFRETLETIVGWRSHWNSQSNPDIQNITRWTWNPQNNSGQYAQRTTQDLQDILALFQNNTIDWHDPGKLPYDPDGTLPSWAHEDVPPLRDFPGRDNTARETNHLHNEPVHKVVNAQGYLQYNTGADEFPAMFGEFGVIRRYIADDTWNNVTGYMSEYDDEPWNN